MNTYTVEVGDPREIIHGPSGYDSASRAFDVAVKGTAQSGGVVELIQHGKEGKRRIIGVYTRQMKDDELPGYTDLGEGV